MQIQFNERQAALHPCLKPAKLGNGLAEIMALLIIGLAAQSDTICQILKNSWRFPANKKNWACNVIKVHQLGE